MNKFKPVDNGGTVRFVNDVDHTRSFVYDNFPIQGNREVIVCSCTFRQEGPRKLVNVIHNGEVKVLLIPRALEKKMAQLVVENEDLKERERLLDSQREKARSFRVTRLRVQSFRRSR